MQILVGVAMIQMRMLKTDVEKGCKGNVLFFVWSGPKWWLYCFKIACVYVYSLRSMYRLTRYYEREIGSYSYLMIKWLCGNTVVYKKNSRCSSRKNYLFFLTGNDLSLNITMEAFYTEIWLRARESDGVYHVL